MLYCPIARRQSRVECPLKSVQYQFAPMFMTVVFNPLAPGSGTGRHKSPGTNPCPPLHSPFVRRSRYKIFSSRCAARLQPRNQLDSLTTDPDRYIFSVFFSPSRIPSYPLNTYTHNAYTRVDHPIIGDASDKRLVRPPTPSSPPRAHPNRSPPNDRFLIFV